ncbi:hypothetical protein H8959_011793 [Pygathrix nigripes]
MEVVRGLLRWGHLLIPALPRGTHPLWVQKTRSLLMSSLSELSGGATGSQGLICQHTAWLSWEVPTDAIPFPARTSSPLEDEYDLHDQSYKAKLISSAPSAECAQGTLGFDLEVTARKSSGASG